MRASNFPLLTTKETPADAEIVSHKLMLRAGMVRKLAAGFYSWLPLGKRVLNKVEQIVREEMDRAGAVEVLLPTIHPAELWQESGRWDEYGPDLMRMKDRHDRDFCLGPTHEEVITDIVRNEIRSYKQLPVNFYQIQTKFRDEIRPRFGIMRGREFIMKDAYSFGVGQDALQAAYDVMYEAYVSVFTRMGLDFRAVAADSGAIGGKISNEFQVLADSGEDAIVFSDASDYAANVELAATLPPTEARPQPVADMQSVATPGAHTIDSLSEFLKVEASQCIKTLLVKGESDGEIVGLVVRGDHTLNAIKAQKLEGVGKPLTMASESDVVRAAGCKPGSLGPVGLNLPLFVDYAAAHLADFICGANKENEHLTGVNWSRDLPEPVAVDIRNVIEGDPSPDGHGTLSIRRGIEVGHIFQLGDKYSQALGATVLDEQGKSQVLSMGCYGIGVTRVIAAAIEQNHDDRGIIWPHALAPFHIAIAPINMHKSPAVAEAAEKLYIELRDAGFEVLLDDRNARPGVMFADLELIGVPHRIVVGDRRLAEGDVEYQARTESEAQRIALDAIVSFLKERVPART